MKQYAVYNPAQCRTQNGTYDNDLMEWFNGFSDAFKCASEQVQTLHESDSIILSTVIDGDFDDTPLTLAVENGVVKQYIGNDVLWN